MDSRLPHHCAILWALGLLGLLVTRCAGLGPGDLGFELCVRLFAVGGLGYLGVGALACTGRDEHGARGAEHLGR